MRKPIATALCLLVLYRLCAQEYHPEYENDWIGWRKPVQFKGVTKPLVVDEKTYSPAQLSIADSFANWMYASIYPKGALGDVSRYVTPKKNPYLERYNAAVPHSYGARVSAYIFLKKQEGKWVPENNLGYAWTIAANETPLAYRVTDYCTDKVCIFTLVRYDEELVKQQPGSDEARTKKMNDVSASPNVKNYIVFDMPARNNTEVQQWWVILSRNNRFPYVPVSIGEAIRFIEEAMPVKYAEEKLTAKEQNGYDPSHLKLAMDNLDSKYNKARQTLARVKEKYRDRLAEPAFVSYSGQVIQSLANGADMFNGSQLGDGGEMDHTMPLFRVDPALEKACSTDQPQWIVVKWFGGTLDQLRFRNFHDAILRNFNFDYVYKFFFDPAAVKGQGYKPLQPPKFTTAETVLETSPVAKKELQNDQVKFFDDFSSTPVGKSPADWKIEFNADGKKAMVVQPAGQSGNWLEIKGNDFVVPMGLKKPLPADFELRFDLAVPRDIPWGTKALELYLCTADRADESKPFLKWRFRAGFSGRPGVVMQENKLPAGYFANVPGETEVPGFSNDKEFNSVSVRMVKKGETMELYVDDRRILRVPKAIPADTRFNFLQFRHLNSDQDNQKYFITNVKLTQIPGN